MNIRLLNLRFAISALHVVLLLGVVSAAAQEAGDSACKDQTPKAQTGENGIIAVSARPASINATVEEKAASDTAGSAVAKPAQAGSSDGWKFVFSPYFFMIGIKGTVGARGLTTEVDAKFTDIIDEVNFGFMARFEARKNKFVISTDMLYANLSHLDETPGPLFSTVEADLKVFVLEPEVGYRVAESERAFLDVQGGIRFWHLKVGLDFQEGILPGIQGEQSKNWVDAVGGLRGKAYLSKKWFVVGKGDLGAGGSDFTWQLFGAGGVDISKSASLVFGYRHLSVDYDDEKGFLFDVALKGPLVGLSLRF